MKKALATFAIITLGIAVSRADTYTQNFDSVGSGLPTGWFGTTGATATGVGTNAPFNSAQVAWSSTTGQFQNSASATGLLSTDTAATQNASTDRDFALRQTGTFGDPGAAFNFAFSTTGVTVSSLSLDLEMLSVQTRSTTFSIQYGVGPSPTTFTTLGTYADPGTFGTTTDTFTTADFGTNLDNQSNVVFRVVALTASTGSGSRDTVGIDNFSLTSSGPITPTAVPEPATWMLMGVGLLVGASKRLRRRA